MTVPALPPTSAMMSRLSGRPLLLMLDIDGTLSPIAPRPEYAIVPPATQELIRRLVAARDVNVAVVSGRSAEDARRMLGVDDAWVIGNHGFELAAPGSAPTARPDVAPFAGKIQEAVQRACALAADTARRGVIVEDKGWTLSVHYRLAHPRIVPELTENIEQIARDLGLRMTAGKEVLELRPPIAVDKGTAAMEMAEQLGATRDGASVLAAGDDRTDEDMFRLLRTRQPRAVTVHVGAGFETFETCAEFDVPDTDAMRELLTAVLALRDSSIGRS